MNPKEALQVLHQISEAMLMNGTDHDRAREAVKVLQDIVNSKEISKDLKVE